MESSVETKKILSSTVKLVIIAVILLICALIIAASIFLSRPEDTDSQTLGYASEAKVMMDEESLKAAMAEAMKNSEEGNIALRYKNNAYSDDGENFSCYIVNSADNSYDMFLTIFTDADLTDQIFLSDLVPPGSGFENITLDRALEPGDHTVYVALTQVKNDENGKQVIHRQVVHTMEFHVTSD